ncbi:MAG: radical SAM protein [Candidatus Tectomicrobia bacterium]|uniref:Radical SAM protein n=1 Tax=Tectimicrobiota bacterium TaxID=2528274 RepID=A0A933GK26_UNCTE|nr:radical SAM protein [Candidatus Tectomicrobia bacterium]
MLWELQKKSQQLLSQEIGPRIKANGSQLSIAIIYPNTYYLGMSNLGWQQVYFLLNQIESVRCERVFLPDQEDIKIFRERSIELRSLETQTPLGEFDILAFSISFENDYLNILEILNLAHIPQLAEKRNPLFHPLVMAGGVCAFSNPEPLTPFIDLFVLGECEPILNPLIEIFLEYRTKTADRLPLLQRLSSLEGLYVPSAHQINYDEKGTISGVTIKEGFSHKTKRIWLKDLTQYPATSRILTANTEFGHMFLIETNRGCPRGCSFCLAGGIYRPVRYQAKHIILEEAKRGLEHRQTIGLVGTALSDHPELEEIAHKINDYGGKISLSSLNITRISPGLLSSLIKSGHKTLTLAPEAGTERLRKHIGKDLSDEFILKTIELIFLCGFSTLKLYFMIGLPSEREEDINGIIQLTKKIKHQALKIGRGKGKLGKITLSVNSFVPKPWTPFQRESMASIPSLREKIKHLKSDLKGLGNIEVIHDLPKWAMIQGLLARGDRRIGKLLLLAWEKGGNWPEAFLESDLNPDFYVFRSRSTEEILPWDHLKIQPSRKVNIR